MNNFPSWKNVGSLTEHTSSCTSSSNSQTVIKHRRCSRFFGDPDKLLEMLSGCEPDWVCAVCGMSLHAAGDRVLSSNVHIWCRNVASCWMSRFQVPSCFTCLRRPEIGFISRLPWHYTINRLIPILRILVTVKSVESSTSPWLLFWNIIFSTFWQYVIEYDTTWLCYWWWVGVKVLHRETFPFSLRFPGTVTIPHSMTGSPSKSEHIM